RVRPDRGQAGDGTLDIVPALSPPEREPEPAGRPSIRESPAASRPDQSSLPRVTSPSTGDHEMATLIFPGKSTSPNEDGVKSKSTQASLSPQNVTGDCHGIANTIIHPIDPVPDWYEPLNNNLNTAKVHANDWLVTLGPQISSTIPTQIIDFNSTFNA